MQMGVGIRQSVADVDTDSLLSQNWPPSPSVRWRSCSETDSATTEKNARNATEFLISVDLGKVWPPLAGYILLLQSKDTSSLPYLTSLDTSYPHY